MIQGCFKGIKKKFKGCFKKISKKVSRVFLECFNEVLFRDFVVAWISSQLPEQKEGLFFYNLSPKLHMKMSEISILSL